MPATAARSVTTLYDRFLLWLGDNGFPPTQFSRVRDKFWTQRHPKAVLIVAVHDIEFLRMVLGKLGPKDEALRRRYDDLADLALSYGYTLAGDDRSAVAFSPAGS